MACQISTISSICDIRDIQKKLFPDWKTPTVEAVKSDSDWEKWNWADEDDKQNVTENEPQNEPFSWLQECLVSISPLGDVMTIARNNIAAFLTLRWHEDSEIKEKFVCSTMERLSDDERDAITCLMCLPLASQKRSLHGRPDWTALLIGFTSGYVKMYTENGSLLISQRFDDTSVTSLKCRTFEPPRYGALAEQEELVVLYKNCVVTIDGFSLYQALRACRNQVARATASGGDVVDAPPLAYKKWSFQSQEVVTDCENVGITYSNSFDHLMHHSIRRGFNGTPHAVVPAASLFITSGKSPYIGFYYAVEGSDSSLVMEVAMAAAHKMKSLITGFFGRPTKPATEKNMNKIEPAVPLPSRFELRDISRLGTTLCISPNRRLTAVTDDFGRVVVIDNNEGIAVRIWKGYRDAQCGWIEVPEELTPENKPGREKKCLPRVTLFLVIYCPRRGILEVWSSQHGPRVAAFNVSRSSRLVSCNHGILGLTNVQTVFESNSLMKHCYLIDCDGQVKVLTVPFHCALSAKHSKRARDLHLLKKIRTAMKESVVVDDKLTNEICTIILDVKTAAVRQQCLLAAIENERSDVNLLRKSVGSLVSSLNNQDPDTLDLESKLLLLTCRRYLQLLQLYEGISNLKGGRTTNEDVEGSKPMEALSAMLHMSEQEVDQLLGKVDKIISPASPPLSKSVSFKDEVQLTPGKFLSCFQTCVTHLPKNAITTTFPSTSLSDPAPLPISLEQNVPEPLKTSLSHFLFCSVIRGDYCFEELGGILLQNGIEIQQLLVLLMHYWLQLKENVSSWFLLRNLYNACRFFCLSGDPSEVIPHYNSVSPWWANIRQIFCETANLGAGLVGALVMRGVSITLIANQQNLVHEVKEKANAASDEKCPDLSCEQLQSSKDTDNSQTSAMDISLSDWEAINLDAEQWNLLVKQLEDLVVLKALLDCNVPQSLSTRHRRTATDVDQFTVAGILNKGRGAISELVAIWLTQKNMDILQNLANCGSSMENSTMMKNCVVATNDSDQSQEVSTSEVAAIEPIDTYLKILEETRLHFPYSLQPDVLFTNASWEIAAQWNKNREEVDKLEIAVFCLKRASSCVWGKGLASLIWHTFFKDAFRSTAYLIEKVGKVPKARLCVKDIGMNDTNVEKFLHCCTELLDMMMRARDCREAKNAYLFRCEEPWQNSVGPTPLVDHAAAQKDPHSDIVCHHYKLALSLHMIMVFGLRSIKPISLYDTRSKAVFFKDFHANTAVPPDNPDLAIMNNRRQFLYQVITAAVLSVPEPNSSSGEGLATGNALKHSNVSVWVGKVMELATLWSIDNDSLWRHYVCELYSSGLDVLAEEVLPSVADREVMGSQMILLAGQRIYNAILASGEDYVEKLAMFPPTVTAWLTTLNQKALRCPNPSLALTSTMVSYIINVIPEHQAEHKMAVSLSETLTQFMGSLCTTDAHKTTIYNENTNNNNTS